MRFTYRLRRGSIIRARCAPRIWRRPFSPRPDPPSAPRGLCDGLHKASSLLKPFLRSARRSPLRSTLSRQASQVPPHPFGTRHRNLTNPTTHRQNFRRFRPLWRHPTPLKRQNIVGLLITWSLTRRQLFPVQNDFLRSRRHDQSSRPCDWRRRAPALPAASRRRAQVCVRRIAGARAQCGWKPRCWPSTKHPGRCSN
jgi:hypothetical protein